MAIVFRNNPMPTTGALYVTNPRKKMKRIPNGIVHRYIYEQVFGKEAPGGRRSPEQVKIKKMIHGSKVGTAAQRKKAQDLYDKIVVKKNKAAVVAFEKWKKPVRAGQRDLFAKGGSQKKTSSKRRTSTTVARRRGSSASTSSRSSSSKSSTLSYNSLTARQKQQVRVLVDTANNVDEFISFAQSSKIAALKKANKTALRALYSDVNKRLKKLNPKRRNAMALAMRKNPKRKTSGKLGKWKGRMMKYATFSKRLAGCGLTAKQKSALWTKYKKTGKLPALAKPKKRLVSQKKTTVSRRSASGITRVVTAKNGRKMHYIKGKLVSKSKYDAHKKRTGSSSKPKPSNGRRKGSKPSQFAKLGADLRKLGYKGKLSLKSLSTVEGRKKKIKALRAKGATMKSYEGVRQGRGVSQKKTTAKRRENTWIIYSKLRKEMSYNLDASGARYEDVKAQYRKDLPKIQALCDKSRKSFKTCAREFIAKKYGEFTAKKSKAKRYGQKAVLAYKRQMAKAGTPVSMKDARDAVKAMGSDASLLKGVYLNPRRRKNIGGYEMDQLYASHKMRQGFSISEPFASVTSVIGRVQEAVSSLPIVDKAAPYVMPVGLGLAVAGVHYYGGKYLGPMIQRVPQIAKLQHAGYTIVGVSTALAIKLGQHFGLFESAAANQIATLAVVTGSFVDGLDYFRSRGQTAIAGVHHTGAVHLGDGGQYFLAPVGQGTQAPVKRQMRQIAGADSDYGAIVAPLSGASAVAGAPMGYGALMYTGAGY